MDCRELKAIIDSYISDELLIETNHEVLRHLENCAKCRLDMAARRMLKTHLKTAIKSSVEGQIDSVFYSRTVSSLRETALRPSSWERMTSGHSLAARAFAIGLTCVLLAVTGTLFWLNRSPDSVFNALNNNTDIANAVRASWAELTSLAVGDHQNCAVEFNLKEHPISLDEAAAQFGAYNKDLDDVMMAAFKATPNAEVSGDVEFIESHSCVYEGRRFAHVVVKHKGEIVSLMMIDTDLPGENDGIRTAIYDGALRSVGFLAGHHAVFVVSQLADTDNVALANAVAPAIRSYVGKPIASSGRIKS